MSILLHATLMLAMTLPASESTVALSGTVVDADGEPVAGATVVVAEGSPALRSMTQWVSPAAPQPPEVLANATSDTSGKFSISLPDEAPESPVRRTRLTVWAHHADSSLTVRLIDRDWPRAGLPLALRLPPAATVRCKVTDANYRPSAQAHVTPLRVAGQLVPEAISARLTADTDAEGRATVAGVVPSELETVRVESAAIGVQWAGMPVGRDKIVLLNLAPVGRVKGRLTADEPRAVARRKLRFATWQMPGDEYSGGGLAEVATDDEGSFDVPALAAGSLIFELLEDGLPSPSPSTSTASEDNPPSAVYLTAQTTGPDVDVGRRTTFEIPLRRAVQVVQEVRDEETQAPIVGARVWIRSGLTAGTTSDTEASGRLTGYVLPGLVSSSRWRGSPRHCHWH